MLSGFRAHSSISKLEASTLTTGFAKKVMLEPPATVDLGLNSAVAHDVSYDSELGALRPWSVGPVKESGCKVLDPGSRVQRVLTRSDGKVEKDTVTLIEMEGEISFVGERHDVERVTATFKNPRRDEIYGRNIRDMLRRTLTKTRCQQW